jgi:phosphoglycerate-specific signal transduction histidine kinase
MMVSGLQDRNGTVEEYLQLLRSLACEVERAMQAISRNSLPDFEESVRKQETLSARVTDIAKELNVFARTGADSHLPHTSDSLMSEIKAASSTLQTLNQRYGALLQHSSRSVALMVSLFDSFRGNLREGNGSRPKLQTWSCQI